MDSKEAKSLNPRAIFSKTGKGVQEASGKTSHLSRADRAVLSAIDGKTMLSDVSAKFEKLSADKFDALIQQLDKDGFVREVSSGAQAAPPPRPTAPAAKAPSKAPSADEGDDMDFTQAVKIPKGPAPSAPKGPAVDLAATARADADRKAKEQQALDYRGRQEAETKAKAEADMKARAAAEARAKADAESKARADADNKTRAEADAKVKAAREAAVRMATEVKAKAEADARVKTEAAEKDKARLEAELNAKLDAERKAREDAERRAADAAELARKELEEKSKRDAEELRQRLEGEMKAKLDAERKAREEEDRKRRDEEDRRRKEEDERRARDEAERKARDEADRKKRDEEDRKRREEDARRRKEDDERRAKEEAERKARADEDRKRREEDERRRKDEDERRALEDTSRRLEADRRTKEDAERKARQEAEAKARAAADAAASLPKIEAVVPPPPPPPPPPAAPSAAAGGGIGDSLLADLDSFGKREEEEQREKEEAERKAKEEKARREKEEAERKAKEEADRKRREEEERRRKEDEARRAQEEEERKAREEEDQRKEEEAERKRKAKEAVAAKQADERAAKAAAAKGAARAAGKGDDDIDVSDDDLDTDDLKRDQKVAADKARKAAREAPPVAVAAGRPRKWGKPVMIAAFVLLVVGVGVLNVMPVSTAEYEKAASDAMGVPVKVSSARLSVLTGIEVKLEGVSIGSAAKIRAVHGTPELGSLFGARKSFSRIELEGVSLSQSQLADALLGKVAGENFRVARIVIKQLVMEGPLKLPPLDVDATVSGDGTLQTVRLTGADKLVATLTPKGSDIGFDISAGSFALPFLPALSLSEFTMKGSATRSGVANSEFDGRAFDGVIGGSARIRWGDNWSVEGEVRPRSLKVAVFAPTLVSDGRVEGRGAFSMSGSSPGSLYENARVQGEFKIEKGVLGSFDVSRALQTGGQQSGGRTVFNELSGQGLYDKGAMQFTNVTFSAGALNAGASLNIDVNGNLSGRIVADLKTASQKQSATLNISGKVQDPVIRK